MTRKKYLVTGGLGFIGSALVRRLIKEKQQVRVIDNLSRGSAARLSDVLSEVDYIQADIRDPEAVAKAIQGVDRVCHLAFVNGTEYFYTKPELVLDVAVKGMSAVLDGCRKHGVKELILASSSEVYQTPPTIPTNESAPISIPDPLNPRYSYAAGKIISEMMALHPGKDVLNRSIIFRPHNVYGPDMGWEHVIPQFATQLKTLAVKTPEGPITFPIQGTGNETRAFVFIDDFIDGLMRVIEDGQHQNIYHIGTQEEVSVADLARQVAACFGRTITLEPGEAARGGTARRCPDITKLSKLGYKPHRFLREGLPVTVEWYKTHDRPGRMN